MSKQTDSKANADKTVRNIQQQTRRKFNPEDKMRIVLAELRGEKSIAELCRREGIRAVRAGGLGHSRSSHRYPKHNNHDETRLRQDILCGWQGAMVATAIAASQRCCMQKAGG